MSTRQQLLNAVQLQENALKFYMGMPIEQNIKLLDEDFQVEELLLAESIDTENRTEFKLLKKQEELLHLQKEAFKADRKSTRLNSSHVASSYAVFRLKNKIRTCVE